MLLDFVRIICALVIYTRHSITMFGCNWGTTINEFALDYTSFSMTCFFMLSGFSLQYSNSDRDNIDLLSFYVKRLIAILPTYYLIHFLFLMIKGRNVFTDWLLLSPVELFGIQSHFRTLFGILHNGGTWFVSCLLFCYLVFPIVHSLLIKADLTTKVTVLIICYSAIVYSNFVCQHYDLARNYDNPFFRALEFTCGVTVAGLVASIPTHWRNARKNVLCLLLVIIGLLPMAALIIRGVSFDEVKSLWMPIPVIAMILYLSTIVPQSERLEKSKILRTLSGMTYQFFLIQLVLWDVSTWVLNLLGTNSNNVKKTVSFSICVILSYVIYRFFDMPIRNIYRNRKHALIKEKP